MRTSLRLAGIQLDRPEGEPLALSALWRERPAVIAWVRHFG
jgi:hypothetical protein